MVNEDRALLERFFPSATEYHYGIEIKENDPERTILLSKHYIEISYDKKPWVYKLTQKGKHRLHAKAKVILDGKLYDISKSELVIYYDNNRCRTEQALYRTKNGNWFTWKYGSNDISQVSIEWAQFYLNREGMTDAYIESFGPIEEA
jgi:hypothetical protein